MLRLINNKLDSALYGTECATLGSEKFFLSEQLRQRVFDAIEGRSEDGKDGRDYQDSDQVA